jgi:hypothetical protein
VFYVLDVQEGMHLLFCMLEAVESACNMLELLEVEVLGGWAVWCSLHAEGRRGCDPFAGVMRCVVLLHYRERTLCAGAAGGDSLGAVGAGGRALYAGGDVGRVLFAGDARGDALCAGLYVGGRGGAYAMCWRLLAKLGRIA